MACITVIIAAGNIITTGYMKIFLNNTGDLSD